MKDDFGSLFAFNRWANARMLDACRKLTPARWLAGARSPVRGQFLRPRRHRRLAEGVRRYHRGYGIDRGLLDPPVRAAGIPWLACKSTPQ